MRIESAILARMMVGRIVGSDLRAQLAALQAVLSNPKFVEYNSTRNVLFGCWPDLAWIECRIRLVKSSLALFSRGRVFASDMVDLSTIV